MFLWVGSKVSLILLGLHLEDVRDDAVNLDVPYKAREEEVLQGLRVQGSERRQKEEETGEPISISGMFLVGCVFEFSHGLVLEFLNAVMI